MISFARIACAAALVGSTIKYNVHAETTVTIVSGLNRPFGLARDANNNLYFSDLNSTSVFEAVASTNYATIKTLPITGVQGYVLAITLDASGNIFAATGIEDVVRELLPPPYTPAMTLGGGSTFNLITDMAIDSHGNLFVADESNAGINEIAAPAYSSITPLAMHFGQLNGIAIDQHDSLYVSQYSTHSVKRMLAANGYTTVETVSDLLTGPTTLAVDQAGNVFVADYPGGGVKEIIAAGAGR